MPLSAASIETQKAFTWRDYCGLLGNVCYQIYFTEFFLTQFHHDVIWLLGLIMLRLIWHIGLEQALTPDFILIWMLLSQEFPELWASVITWHLITDTAGNGFVQNGFVKCNFLILQSEWLVSNNEKYFFTFSLTIFLSTYIHVICPSLWRPPVIHSFTHSHKELSTFPKETEILYTGFPISM